MLRRGPLLGPAWWAGVAGGRPRRDGYFCQMEDPIGCCCSVITLSPEGRLLFDGTPTIGASLTLSMVWRKGSSLLVLFLLASLVRGSPFSGWSGLDVDMSEMDEETADSLSPWEESIEAIQGPSTGIEGFGASRGSFGRVHYDNVRYVSMWDEVPDQNPPTGANICLFQKEAPHHALFARPPKRRDPPEERPVGFPSKFQKVSMHDGVPMLTMEMEDPFEVDGPSDVV